MCVRACVRFCVFVYVFACVRVREPGQVGLFNVTCACACAWRIMCIVSASYKALHTTRRRLKKMPTLRGHQFSICTAKRAAGCRCVGGRGQSSCERMGPCVGSAAILVLPGAVCAMVLAGATAALARSGRSNVTADTRECAPAATGAWQWASSCGSAAHTPSVSVSSNVCVCAADLYMPLCSWSKFSSPRMPTRNHARDDLASAGSPSPRARSSVAPITRRAQIRVSCAFSSARREALGWDSRQFTAEDAGSLTLGLVQNIPLAWTRSG